MDNLIRTDTVFGKRANIVGNISADLVLESLGKVYIKSRNKALTIEELIQSLVIEDPNVSTSRVKVVEGIENLDTSEFKEGTFVFDKLSNILYLFIDDELLELINVAPDGNGYVKRSGDTMTGRLAIYVKNGPPLYVNSATLVENLNALYLNGETSESFTRRNRDENINGKWTFRRPITFESNSLFLKDIVLNGSIGSLSFAGGFGGYGWRMDADTNTLTIDNLVVRKLMLVYELVVNKISATNGSLWVSNAGKVTKVEKLEIKFSSFFSDTEEYKDFRLGLKKGEYFIKIPNPVVNKSFADALGAFSNASGNNPRIKECWDESTLGSALVIGVTGPSDDYFEDSESTNYHTYKLFSEDFRFNCVFPIVTRNNYKRYKDDKALAEATNNNPPEVFNYVSLIYSYYKYFANGDYYLVSFDDDSLPVFKPGDILRCLKWTYGGIKYYDAIVCNYLESKYIILLAPSFYDLKTVITYNSSLDAETTYQEDKNNLTLYKQTANYKLPSEDSNRNINIDELGNAYNLSYEDQLKKNLGGVVEEKDSLVLMGHLWDSLRLNAVYITSTDNGAPYLDVISGVNRPDYSIIYYVPIYKTVKLNVSNYTNIFTGYEGLVNIPYTGDYYVLKEESFEYILFEYNGLLYLSTNRNLPQVLGGTVKRLYYLSTAPNAYTLIGDSAEFYNILSEDGKALITEDENNYIVLENLKSILQVASTRTTKARLGNLEGIQDEIFPINRLPYGYGLYALNVFLTGEFYLNNGRSLAEIGTDAIQFALASSNSIYDSILILKEDTERADNLLKQSVYTRGELRSAGMRIGKDSEGNPGIVMWGNKILIATTAAEFDGKVDPTVLFANGRIAAKFISVNNIHSALGYGLPSNVFLKEYTHTDGSKYYKEELILSEEIVETEGEDPVVKYYYINSLTGDKEYLTGQESILPGNSLYGWNLEATGEGYLAQGNIRWEKDGELFISGDLTLKYPSGLHLINDEELNSFNITGRNVTDAEAWAVLNGPITLYNMAGSYFSSLSEYILGTTLIFIRDLPTTFTPGSRIEFSWLYPIVYADPIYTRSYIPIKYVLYIKYQDGTEYIYRNDNQGDYILNTTSHVLTLEQKEITNFRLAVLPVSEKIVIERGYFKITGINLASEIGGNFISFVTNEKETNKKNMLWFGDDGLKVGSFGGEGLVVDTGGVGLIKKNNSTENSISSLAQRLAGSYDRYDLFKALDNTLNVTIISTDHLYSTYDPNEGKDIEVMGGPYGSGNNAYIRAYLRFGPIRGKVYIIRPSTTHKIILLLVLSSARVGSVITVVIDPVNHDNIKEIGIEPLYHDSLQSSIPGRLYKKDSGDYVEYSLDTWSDKSYIKIYDFDTVRTMYVRIMYLGDRSINGIITSIFKIL